MTRHRGKHRKKGRPVWRRLLQASALGAAVATVAAALWAPKHGDTATDVGEHPFAVSPSSDSTVQPTAATTALPDLADAASAAAAAATPPPTTTTRRPPPPPAAPRTTAAPAPRLAACSSTGWGVKPHVARAGHAIAKAFGLLDSLIGGFRSSSAVAGSDHPKGLALDFTAAGAFGDRIAAYAVEHRAELAVTYVIWRQRINYGTGWQPMEDRGSATANHFDHVHVSFSAAPAGSPTC